MTERPSIKDDYVRRRAAEIVMPKIIDWLGGDFAESERKDITEQLMKVASTNDNGFDKAKNLERNGWWAPDAALVEILDGRWVDDAIDELTVQWVRCLNIRPELAIGDPVMANTHWRRDQIGTVTRVDESHARYGVRYSDMQENSWTWIDFEKCAKPSVQVA